MAGRAPPEGGGVGHKPQDGGASDAGPNGGDSGLAGYYFHLKPPKISTGYSGSVWWFAGVEFHFHYGLLTIKMSPPLLVFVRDSLG